MDSTGRRMEGVAALLGVGLLAVGSYFTLAGFLLPLLDELLLAAVCILMGVLIGGLGIGALRAVESPISSVAWLATDTARRLAGLPGAAWRGLARAFERTPRLRVPEPIGRYLFHSEAPPQSEETDAVSRGETGLGETAEGPRRVGSGGFRLDRSRALEKLSRFQYPDPEAFLLPWIRCAVASRAGRIELNAVCGGLRLEFDGEPLPSRATVDPLGCLFQADGVEQRETHLAYGLLALLRLRPRWIRIASGREASRRAVLLGASEASRGAPPACPAERTVLEAHWGGLGRLPTAWRCLELARSGFGLADAELRLCGRAVPDLQMAGPGLRRWSRPEPGLKAVGQLGRGRWRLYKHGALVEEVEGLSGGWDGCVSYDRFSLDASQTHVLRDAAFRRVEALAAGELGDAPTQSWDGKGAAARGPGRFELAVRAARGFLVG